MPIYEYRCLKCEKEHEFLQKFSDDPITTCPECGGEMKKLISANSFVLKGTGWYVTDYGTKKNGNGKDGKEEKKKADSAEKKTETVGT